MNWETMLRNIQIDRPVSLLNFYSMGRAEAEPTQELFTKVRKVLIYDLQISVCLARGLTSQIIRITHIATRIRSRWIKTGIATTKCSCALSYRENPASTPKILQSWEFHHLRIKHRICDMTVWWMPIALIPFSTRTRNRTRHTSSHIKFSRGEKISSFSIKSHFWQQIHYKLN